MLDHEDFQAIEDRFDSIVSNINIPHQINMRQSYLDTLDIINAPNRKISSLRDNLHHIARSLKITPLTYVDEAKFYSYVDAAYKIYQQLLHNNSRFSSRNAWLIAHIAMFNWYYRALLGTSLSGREVEREVDFAIRSPIYFSIVNCLMGLVKVVITATTIYFGTKVLPDDDTTDKGRLILFGYYIISMIVNFIKVSIKIYKASDNGLDPVKPIV
jgi:hypothetical protein